MGHSKDEDHPRHSGSISGHAMGLLSGRATPAMIRAAAEVLAREIGIPLENLGEEARGTYTRLAEKMLKAAVKAADGDATARASLRRG